MMNQANSCEQTEALTNVNPDEQHILILQRRTGYDVTSCFTYLGRNKVSKCGSVRLKLPHRPKSKTLVHAQPNSLHFRKYVF